MKELGGSVEFDERGYRAAWSHSSGHGYGVFNSLDNALEKVGFEECGIDVDQWEFGGDPDETLSDLMERSRIIRRRSSLLRVHTRRNPGHHRRRKGGDGWLVIALVCTTIGFLVGRSKSE